MSDTRKPDSRVTKRKVVMRSVTLNADGSTLEQEAVDYVRPDFLQGYIDDAKTRWQFVTSYEDAMASKPDAGPGGYEGQTFLAAAISGVGEDITVPAEPTEKG